MIWSKDGELKCTTKTGTKTKTTKNLNINFVYYIKYSVVAYILITWLPTSEGSPAKREIIFKYNLK